MTLGHARFDPLNGLLIFFASFGVFSGQSLFYDEYLCAVDRDGHS
jgi:hypothetical protein